MRLAKLLTLAFACGSASALPVIVLPGWFGHISLEGLVGYLGYTSDLAQDETIYQVLKDDKQYSCLVKAIDLSESVVALLNDPSKSLTFFALPDSKFPCHHKHRHGDHGREAVPFFADSPDDVSHGLGDLIQRAEELEKEPESRDKEKRKQALALIIRKIVEYHILPESYEAAELVQNSTYATSLTLDDGSMDSQPLRLSIRSISLPPHLRIKINVFVEVTKRDIKAKNGVIHQISHPLLPPPSIFQETFFVPEVFSFFTSAIQRVGLAGAIDHLRCSKHGNNVDFLGATATTVFTPTSGAFKRLPRKLRRYLFSPFGRKALKKLLEYHIIPNFVLHTDYFHNATSDVTESGGCFEDALAMESALPILARLDDDDNVEHFALSTNTGPLSELVYEYNATLPTLLQDHHLRVHVARYKSKWPIPGSARYFTRFKVNGRRVGLYDIPARNGALHVLSTILDPRQGRDHYIDSGDDEAAWDDWEEWLPQWAVEN
ncbi:FAS1 domain-containing protein [Boletus edulis]|nr:FAS1 domain-containing protein [Boletus edulis]